MPFLHRSQPGKRLPLLLLPQVLITLLFFSGCAIKPWNRPLTESEFNTLKPFAETMRDLQAQCSPCLDGNVTISIDTQLGGRKLSGYMIIAPPDKLKFVAHNPLGQPIIAVSGDKSSFQYLDTMKRVVLTGQPLLLCRELGLPEVFASKSWGVWLSGFFPARDKLAGMKEDKEGKGVWLKFAEDTSGLQEHILIQHEIHRVISRIITRKDKIVLRLDYHYQDMKDKTKLCSLPEEITVSGFDYATEVSMEFSDVAEVELWSPADFDLPQPVGYTTRHFGDENH
ncbi:hypothetical protein [Desulfopila sp. IMCC35008]|uniref:hypothetical protein n=1 Tax=Desulfopila sp. IMCC35008 TaxID=2653858 RepID=UPI0013D3BEE5|nr:hypothetical protein [Desulfopila sp. IMCC35008]